MNRITQSTKIDCYIKVAGEASDADDEGVQGYYLVQAQLSRPASPDQLTAAEQSEIAKAVLDSFHNHQGIVVLDDFDISVFLPNGEQVIEQEDAQDTGLVAHADHQGQVDADDLPFPINTRPQDEGTNQCTE